MLVPGSPPPPTRDRSVQLERTVLVSHQMQTDTSARGTSAESERASGRAPAEVNEYIRTDTRPRVCVCVCFLPDPVKALRSVHT